ncbi:MAG: DUF333 domain-containing protein [Bacteroidetes bacterium]|nr:DUF333 domain-containing protein [Bacteroidota bacterium]
MKKIILFIFLAFSISIISAQKGFITPAAKYCQMLGYQFEISLNTEGNQVGMCVLPDGKKVNAWDFFKGKVAQEYSYAAKYGFDIETVVEEIDGYTTEYAVCISEKKGEETRIPLVKLMELNGEPLFEKENIDLSSSLNTATFDPNFKAAKSLPTSFDWRNKDGHTYIGGVRAQGNCGSCYAFAATATAEGTYNVATNNYDGNCADFSESYIAWCLGSMSAYSSHFNGCGGADYDYQELQALTDIGTVDESYFPYSDADNQSCNPATTNAPKIKFEAWHRVACNDANAIKTAIMTYGVVDAAIYVSSDLQNYSGGVFSDNSTSCTGNPCYNTTTNHAISLVGWGHDATKGDYWILRNSWGSTWGESGYMRIAVTSAHVGCSVCYMVYNSNQASVPTLTTASASSIQDNSAVCGGNISADGGATISQSGVVYSTSVNPTTASSKVATSPTVTSGSFTCNLSGLASGTIYHARSFASNSAGTAYGADKQFTTTGTAPIEYCVSKGNTSTYEHIGTVTIGDFTNTSGAAGYTDFTSKVINLSVGSSYSVSLTPVYGSSAYNEYWKIWIDYNHDGDFTDANELAFDTGSLNKTTVTGSFTVPSISEITTRMRVSMKYNGEQTSCETFSYGEVEDYTVVINNQGGDTEAPTAPASLTASNIAQTSVNLNWNASYDNIGVTEYDIYKDGSIIGSTANTSCSVTGLTAATSYSFYVKAKDEAGNVSAASNTKNVTTLESVDTEAPTAPASLTASNISQTSVVLAWNASSDNVGVTGYDVYKNGSLLASTANTSYSVTGLTAATSYSFYVKAKDEAGNISAASNTKNVTTLDDSNPTNYCTSQGNDYSGEWISKVEIGSFSNTSAASGYTDFTSKTVELSAGISTDITLTQTYSGSSYKEYFKIWIDYNNDGDFDDNGELAYDEGSASSSVATGTITAPSSAIGVTTRMRISMKYNAAPTACESFSYGEVEDYTVSVVDGGTPPPPPPASYCSSKGNTSTYEWIDLVQIGGIDNATGNDGGYMDYTNLTGNIAYGSNTMYFSTGYKSSSYTEYWHVWIDYNHDGDFDDAGEEVVSGSSSSSNTLQASFDVPTSATLGNTRMRITMKYNAAATSACETFSYGEVEDYTVNITASKNSSSSSMYAEMLSNEDASFKIYPNPASDYVNISLPENSENVHVTIYNMTGSAIRNITIDSNSNRINVSDIASGVYSIIINDGNKIITDKLIK